MSIDGAAVRTVPRLDTHRGEPFSEDPSRRNLQSVSFALVPTMRAAMGTPIILARRPEET